MALGVMFVVLVAAFGTAPLLAQAQDAKPAAPAPQAGGPQTGGPQTTPQAQTIDRYVVGSARPPVEPGTELLELTLDQAYALALEKNLDLKVARMTPILNDYTLQSMRGAYRPNFSGSYGYSNNRTPSNNVLEGVENVINIGQNFSSSVNQTIRWYGAPSVSASFSNSRSSTNNVTARLNPGYTSRLSLSFSMSLLRDFKIDSQRNQWRTFAITREITDLTLLQTIDSIKNQVRTSYWNLRQAIEQIEIARRALEITKRQMADALLRVEIGTAAPIDTVQWESSVAQGEQSLLAAQISWRTAELNFKRLLVSGMDDELYRKTINPTDRPELTVQAVDIQAAVTKALAERTDMIINRKNMDVRRFNLQVTEQQLKPNLSFNAGWGANGQGGTQHVGGVTIPGGYGDALSALGSFSNPAWNLGFSVSYRLGQLQERAAVATARIQLDQEIARQKVQELTVSTAVINAGLAVENSYKQYLASVKSREAQERTTEAAQVRFENGMATNFEVVQLQNQLTSSRLAELNAIIRYMNALAEFERVQRVGG
jgi:outer membrane protein TolC